MNQVRTRSWKLNFPAVHMRVVGGVILIAVRGRRITDDPWTRSGDPAVRGRVRF